MKSTRCFVLIAAVLSVLSPAMSAPALEAPAPLALDDALVSVPVDYRLDIGDTVRVDVLRHANDGVNANVLIPADGMVRLPRLKASVQARGKTCAELAQALAANWSHVFRLRPGQVTVAVVGQRVRRIYVRGNAIKSTELNLQPGWRVSELVTLAGMPNVPVDRVTALLTNARRPEPVRVDLDKALNVPGSLENLPLLEGDTLTVDTARTIRLLVAGEGPRGQHEVDYRYGLRRALTQMSYSITGASGSLREARIYRKEVPGDPNSAEQVIPVDLLGLMKSEAPEIPLRDQDLLYIPATERYVYVFGEAGGPRKQFMPEDRKTYLVDVIANAGGTTVQAKIGEVGILREVDGKTTKMVVDFGKYLKTQDARYNPEIQPKDIVYVPKVNQRVGFSEVFNSWGVIQILKTGFGIF